ncbi:hypothetical protein IMW75_26475 [Pseudomonas gregormendelii]|uniref:Uncharacterized protein n=1 Tax=Pseudomonas gregormendelii TaxID=1628277 RepID=A0ABS3ANN4_9PSED|nr:hypothetical protein [Pseudomonas gregormendelii]MBN3968795.1 hypothetical protein [Pseudomonas gregormendelii]
MVGFSNPNTAGLLGIALATAMVLAAYAGVSYAHEAQKHDDLSHEAVALKGWQPKMHRAEEVDREQSAPSAQRSNPGLEVAHIYQRYL